MRESPVQQRVQLELAKAGALPMRNNVGACVDETGRMIRYGLMNTSRQENERFKSSDIIAPVPVLIQPHHVGRTVGVFGVFEVKHSDWHLTPGDLRAQAQARFINLVLGVGGMGGFVNDPAQVQQYIRGFTGV